MLVRALSLLFGIFDQDYKDNGLSFQKRFF